MITHRNTSTFLARTAGAAVLSALALAALGVAPAHAVGPKLVTNGGFETGTSITPPGQNTPALSYSIDSANGGGTVTGWTTSGYNFVYASPSDAMNTGAWTPQFNAYTKLWDANVVTGTSTGAAVDPNGGRFIAADGAFQVGAISQVVQGLTPGAQYDVSFYWGGAQQTGFTGVNTEGWSVSLGSQTQATQIVTNVSQGFTGWMYTTMTFTAQTANATLSFLANGTPSGQPPFALLDGVSLVSRSSVPEPATLLLLAPAFAAVTALRRRRVKAA